ncbi:LysE family translocator [Rhodovulum adriaticum]|uniref:Threonine/homoserine/homoserine lactone efflux protein n=1 Tax=Rhodovulum adriaticum TaxID=35804 RepID=A0A4R2NU13_RHOAD|nr:LysE family transporter [Rhodovulum adriaticum]MBK1636879.1 transporter [Rhodovulum adriaticum]TCP25377.1 threonine/homoserine/homoserine lactone efflux protein [Rhodovulum adriaticum]
MTLAAFLSVCLIHLLAAMSPGPSFVVSARTAATEGFRTAAALAVGFGLGAALWATAAMAGLALLFELVPALFVAMKLGGAAFLLFIAVMMWRHARTPLPEAGDLNPRGPLAAIRLGFLTFASNPKTAIFFGAVFVGLVPAEAPLAVRAALIAVIFCNETLWYLAVARLFSLPRARNAYGRFKALLDRAFGTLIAAFGLKIAFS